MKFKCACFLIGGSFRSGGECNTSIGDPSSFWEQREACLSHVDFFKQFSNEIDFEVNVITYSSKFNSFLTHWYQDYNPKVKILHKFIGFLSLFDSVRTDLASRADLDTYDFIFVSRIDIVYKSMMNYVFKYNSSKVLYPFVCWHNACYTHPMGRLRVSDVFVLIPKDKYEFIFDGQIQLRHNACDLMSDYIYNEIDFGLLTLHDSDSAKDFNPLYKIVNRPESKKWKSRGFQVNLKEKTIEC